MKALRPLLAALVLAAAVPAGAQPDNRLHYGSRPVNVLTIVSRNGIGTADATIMIRHTPEDAKYFCVNYAQDRSPECVARLLESVKVRDRVTGDCVAKTWTDMYGKQYAFLGRATDADQVDRAGVGGGGGGSLGLLRPPLPGFLLARFDGRC